MDYNREDLEKILLIGKSIFLEGEEIKILRQGKLVTLDTKQLFVLLKKLHFYLELDEKCIDHDGPQFGKVWKK